VTEQGAGKSAYAPPRAVVLDDTAALALGAGNRMASRLVVEAEKDPSLRVYIPAVSLAVAECERAGVTEHIGALSSIDISPLDYPAALAVGKRLRICEGDDEFLDWSRAHAEYMAFPSVEWPRGRPILTRNPKRYAGTGIRAITLEE
jgi:hypothetical protein